MNVFDYLPMTFLITQGSISYSSQMDSLGLIINNIEKFVDRENEKEITENNNKTENKDSDHENLKIHYLETEDNKKQKEGNKTTRNQRSPQNSAIVKSPHNIHTSKSLGKNERLSSINQNATLLLKKNVDVDDGTVKKYSDFFEMGSKMKFYYKEVGII